MSNEKSKHAPLLCLSASLVDFLHALASSWQPNSRQLTSARVVKSADYRTFNKLQIRTDPPLLAGSVAAAENLSDGATFLKAEHTFLHVSYLQKGRSIA